MTATGNVAAHASGSWFYCCTVQQAADKSFPWSRRSTSTEQKRSHACKYNLLSLWGRWDSAPFGATLIHLKIPTPHLHHWLLRRWHGPCQKWRYRRAAGFRSVSEWISTFLPFHRVPRTDRRPTQKSSADVNFQKVKMTHVVNREPLQRWSFNDIFKVQNPQYLFCS